MGLSYGFNACDGDDLMPLYTTLVPAGSIIPYGGKIAPGGWVMCDGTAISRTTYSSLFGAIVPLVGTFTVTIASPAVVTLSGHGFVTGDQVYLTTTGALPTGLTANTLYYVYYINTTTFSLATSRANAYAATRINTSGTQSGVHSLYACPFGLGDGSTTFTLPDARGRVIAGQDTMNGAGASRLSLATTQGSYGNPGASGGNQSHTLVTSEIASHNHNPGTRTTAGGADQTGTGIPPHNGVPSGTQQMLSTNTGGDGAHNNVQATLVTNYIIKF